MVNLTIRNIPEEIINKIKILSKLEKRSLNSEILVLLESALNKEIELKEGYSISKEIQIKLWEELAGLWKDGRNTKEIIDDIYSSRTIGREVEL